MARRKGIYDWEHEPAGERRTGYNSTVASDWQQSTQSTFASPSRLQLQRQQRRQRRFGWQVMLMIFGVMLFICAAVLAAWPALSRLLQR